MSQIVPYSGGLAYRGDDGRVVPVPVEHSEALQKAIAVINRGCQPGQEQTFYAAQSFAIALLGKDAINSVVEVAQTGMTQLGNANTYLSRECESLRQEKQRLEQELRDRQSAQSVTRESSTELVVVVGNAYPTAEQIVLVLIGLFFAFLGLALFTTRVGQNSAPVQPSAGVTYVQ